MSVVRSRKTEMSLMAVSLRSQLMRKVVIRRQLEVRCR